MMLHYSKDDKTQQNSQKVHPHWKWNVDIEVDGAIDRLKHQDMVGLTKLEKSGINATIHGFKISSPFRKLHVFY